MLKDSNGHSLFNQPWIQLNYNQSLYINASEKTCQNRYDTGGSPTDPKKITNNDMEKL